MAGDRLGEQGVRHEHRPVDGGLHHHLSNSGNFGQVLRKNYPVVIGTRMDDATRATLNIVGPLCTPLDIVADSMQLLCSCSFTRTEIN